MNGKHYIGKRASSLELYDEIGPITGVALIVDDKNKCFAGDESGYVLTAECPYATDQMAADALAKVQNKTYLGYRSTDTVLPVDAELGDGVTVGGIYSMLAYRKVSFGPGHMSEISAPGENEVDHEYPYISSTKRETGRKLAQTRSMITKSAEEINLRIDSVEEGMTDFNVSLEGITQRVEDAEGTATEAKLAIDGFTVTDDTGTTKIKGSSIETDTLTVNAANITGTVKASVLMGGEVKLAYAQTMLGEPVSSGGLFIRDATTADYAIDLQSDAALRILAGSGALYLSNNNTHVTFSANTNEPGTMTFGHVTPSQSNRFDCGTSGFYWRNMWAYNAPITVSDERLKNSIEDLPRKYVDFILWLSPKRFRMNEGTSGRFHPGFTAQDVKAGMDRFGIDSLEFAGWIKAADADGNEFYMLRYEEFIALILAAVQEQQKVIEDHEERLKKLEAMMNG